jgi:hypothetical protein
MNLKFSLEHLAKTIPFKDQADIERLLALSARRGLREGKRIEIY